MKHYIGNTGRFCVVEDLPSDDELAFAAANCMDGIARRNGRPRGGLGLPFGIELPFGLEMADAALLLLFFLLYIESGDFEFLLILIFLGMSIMR